MLRPEEILALRGGEFELECLHMALVLGGTESPTIRYVGPGRIYQDAEAYLHFRMYVPDAEPRLPLPDLPAGATIPESAYWRLSALDYYGRNWTCPQVWVEPGWSQPGRGSILAASLPFLEGTETLRRAIEGGAFTGYVFHNLRLPPNRRTQTRTDRDTEWREGGRWDTSVVQIGNLKFLMHQEEAQLRATVRDPTGPLPPHFAERYREALQFVAAYPISWAATIETTGSDSQTFIRGRPSHQIGPRIQPPIPRNIAHAEAPTWRLFEAYFTYVLRDTRSEIHRISAEWREVLRSSTGLVETEALICTITVESLCRYLQDQEPEIARAVAAPPGSWAGRVDEFLAGAGAPERIRRRVSGLFGRMTHTDHTDVLVALQQASTIDSALVDAWSRWRPIMAHGDREAQAQTEDLARGVDAVVTLLYQLYFHMVGYRGPYNDFSRIPWRVSSYPPGTALDGEREAS